MSKTDVWMPWYIMDYMKDTGELSLEEDGFYRRALDQIWVRRGSIPADQSRLQQLLRVTGRQFKSCSWILGKFFYRDGENYRNRRSDAEIKRWEIFKAQRAKGADITNAKRIAERNAQRAAETPLSVTPPPSPLPLPSEEIKINVREAPSPWAVFKEPCERLFGKPTGHRAEARLMQLIPQVAALGTVEDLGARVARYRLCWPNMACTLQAVIDNWNQIPNLKNPEETNGKNQLDGRSARSRKLDDDARELLREFTGAITEGANRPPIPAHGDFFPATSSGSGAHDPAR